MPQHINVRRVYDESLGLEGTSILVDGLWPRGIRRSDWPGSSWRPDLAPSRELREWYRHAPERFEEFRKRYVAELESNPAVGKILAIPGTLTLVTATKDVDLSHAAVLRDFLGDQSG